MKNYTTKPFNLNELSQDTKVVTKKGNRAIKITYIPELDTGRSDDKCVSAVILKEGDRYHNSLKLFTKTGKYSKWEPGSDYDLFIAEEFEEFKGYVLVVFNKHTGRKEFCDICMVKSGSVGKPLNGDYNRIVVGHIPVTLSTKDMVK